jgi:hypothetical protein
LRAVPEVGLSAPSAFVIVSHLPGANATGAEDLWVLLVLHVVDISDRLVLAHLADSVGFAAILNVDAGPSLVWNIRPAPLARRAFPFVGAFIEGLHEICVWPANHTLLEVTAGGELIIASGSGNGYRFAEIVGASSPSGWSG